MEFVQADMRRDRGDVRALWSEYLEWANDRLDDEFHFRLDIAATLEENMEKPEPFQPPDGRLLLAREEDAVWGVGCLKQIRPGVGEIKRMYVRPAARGRGLGQGLLEALLSAARVIGYRSVLLDSAKYMHAAHALYQRCGFERIDPYPESEIPPELQKYWIFMRLDLEGRP